MTSLQEQQTKLLHESISSSSMTLRWGAVNTVSAKGNSAFTTGLLGTLNELEMLLANVGLPIGIAKRKRQESHEGRASRSPILFPQLSDPQEKPKNSGSFHFSQVTTVLVNGGKLRRQN